MTDSGAPPPPPPPPGLPDPKAPSAAAAAGTAQAASGPYGGYPSYEAYCQAYAAYYGPQYAPPRAAEAAAASGNAAPPASGTSAAAPAYDYSQYYAGYSQQNQQQQYDYSSYQNYQGASWQQQGCGAPGAAAALPPAPSTAGPSYRAVPPPSSIPVHGRRGVGRGAPPGLSRPQPQHQHQYQRLPPPGSAKSTLVSAAQAAAAAISAGQAPPKPAYISVQSGGTKAAGGAAAASPLNPATWPPAVKVYVERAFKAAPIRYRSKLQDVLRILITDAQNKGELLTRSWDTLPLPDLLQPAQDAAAVILEVCAVSSVGGYNSQTTAGTGTWRQQQQQRPTPSSTSGAHGHGGTMYANRSSARGMVRSDNESTDYSNSHKSYTNSRKRTRWSARNPWSDSDSDDDDGSQGGPYSADEEARRRRRAGRFKDGSADGAKPGRGNPHKSTAARRAKLSALLDDVGGAGEDIDWDSFAIKGTCQKLEKSYFRLTSAPDPSTVRPEPVLRKALDRLVGLIASGEVNYFYTQDQFKGLRQDCVVQALRGPLALAVYEAHARAALEYGDVAEYNQCQGQMATLWGEGVSSDGKCEAEFLACRILYQTVHARHGEQLGLLHTLRKFGPKEAEAPEIAHSLEVRSAVASEDYALFFRLYSTAPKLGRALMDLAVPRLRFAALNTFVKAFKPTLPVAFLARLLGFVAGAASATEKSQPWLELVHEEQQRQTPLPGCALTVFVGAHAAKESEEGIRECIEWLSECGAVVTGTGDDAIVDCKATAAGQLQMPPEKEKVAHGDANLDIGDFLKSFDGA